MNIVATNNLYPQFSGIPVYHGLSPGLGVGEWDNDLNFGASGFTMVAITNMPSISDYGGTFYNFGPPIVNCCNIDHTSSKPTDGFGLWYFGNNNTLGYSFRMFNGWDGSATSGPTYRHYAPFLYNLTPDAKKNRWGLWNILAVHKKTSVSTIIASLNGIDDTNGLQTNNDDGSLSSFNINQYGHNNSATWTLPAKIRYFHSIGVTSISNEAVMVNTTFHGAAGIWILNHTLTDGLTDAAVKTLLDGITLNVSNLKTAMETTHLKKIITRSYAGEIPWDLAPVKYGVAPDTFSPITSANINNGGMTVQDGIYKGSNQTVGGSSSLSNITSKYSRRFKRG